MKKLFAIAIAASMLSGLYGLTLGLGVAYEDVAEDGRYLCIKGDARVPIMPIVDWRAGCTSVQAFHQTYSSNSPCPHHSSPILLWVSGLTWALRMNH
jgi:hypothetical protein